MELQYVYQKKRSEFGRQCLFSDKGPELIDNYPANHKLFKDYILKDPVNQSVQCSKTYAEHYVNTMRAEYTNGGMNHTEGGWPKDVNFMDEEQTKRYRRKVEKDEGYSHTILQLCKTMENCILQNNAMNIYQQYYSDVEPTPLVERSSARTVNVFNDQCSIVRPVTHISWSPDGGNKIAVSHCNLKFQRDVSKEKTHSYIWETENPNRPLYVLQPPTSTVCLEYNQKDANFLVSGQFNGLVATWDMRRGTEPVDFSLMEHSHRDPVNNVLWINSKSGTEFFSASTDGHCKWWDTRKLIEPIETLILDQTKEEQHISNALGASCLEYEPTIPTRFMVGTEQGIVLNCNRKGKTPTEKIVNKYAAHFGPVLTVQRNPAFVKNFLTIGDWTAKIWSEDCRESCVMWTSFHKSLLNSGCWSPTRFSCYFTTRSDGRLDVWDILQTQKQASLSVKICDSELKSIRAHEMGRLIAVGNLLGSVYLVELSENLTMCNKNDKMLLTAMFEREGRREKILEARNREIKLKLALEAKASAIAVKAELEDEDLDEESIDAGTLFLQNPAIVAATEEFNATIYTETRGHEHVEEEEDINLLGDEPLAIEEPPPLDLEPELSVTPVKQVTPKKGKKKGKKK